MTFNAYTQTTKTLRHYKIKFYDFYCNPIKVKVAYQDIHTVITILLDFILVALKSKQVDGYSYCKVLNLLTYLTTQITFCNLLTHWMLYVTFVTPCQHIANYKLVLHVYDLTSWSIRVWGEICQFVKHNQ